MIDISCDTNISLSWLAHTRSGPCSLKSVFTLFTGINKSLPTPDCAAYVRPKLCSSAIPNICLATVSVERCSVVTLAAGMQGWNIHGKCRKENTEVSSGRWVIDDPPSCLLSCYLSYLVSHNFSILHDNSRVRGSYIHFWLLFYWLHAMLLL